MLLLLLLLLVWLLLLDRTNPSASSAVVSIDSAASQWSRANKSRSASTNSPTRHKMRTCMSVCGDTKGAEGEEEEEDDDDDDEGPPCFELLDFRDGIPGDLDLNCCGGDSIDD